ncbi:MAG: amidohydrolase, partial [Acidimicrobiia bacterium]|nr:amidohydrolase [Acidimicrobiia bacterium]
LSSIIAFHVDPTIPAGQIGTRVGAVTGSADRFNILLEGPGGHTARPHKTVDLLWAAGKVLTDLPMVFLRSVDSRQPVTIVFGTAHGGSIHNVIPTRMELGGTVRTTDLALWADLPAMFEKVLRDVLAPTGATATVDYQTGLPPVINDGKVVHAAEGGIAAALGSEAVVPTAVSMGAEDFSRYLERIPGALFRLGACHPDRSVDLHSSSFQGDEDAVGYGIHAGVAALLAQFER